MAFEVIMPKLGLTMEEGTITAWLRQEGEAITEGEALFEVETDKVTMDVPAPASGILRKVLAEPGVTLEVGKIIAIIAQPDESLDDQQDLATESPQTLVTPKEKQPKSPVVGKTEISPDLPFKASPAAKKLAKEHAIDLRSLTGSGPGGRIIESDVLQAIKSRSASTSQTGLDVTRKDDLVAKARSQEGEIIVPKGIRKRTAERMAESFRTIPHFYLTMEVLAGRLVALREALLVPVLEQTGIRVSYTDLLIKGLALALRGHPEANSAWEEGVIRRNSEVNIGLAVATKDGLVVPVIHRADTRSIAEIAKERKALVDAAQSRKIGLDVLEGGTATLTNLGAYEVDTFAPIINPPQAIILAAGRVTERAVVIGGKLMPHPTLFLTLAADHRILDGHEAATFLGDIRKWIEAAQIG